MSETYKDRPGYVLVGFAMGFRHWKTGAWIYSKNGKPFPIWRKKK